MVIIVLSEQVGMPETGLVHYDSGVYLAQAQFEETYGFRPKYGFMRLGKPEFISIASDPDYNFTLVKPSGSNNN